MASQGKIVHGRWLVRRWDLPAVPDGAFYEEDGRVVEADSFAALRRRHPSAVLVGGADRVVLPGFVNAHSHGRGFTTYQMGQPDEPLETRIIEMAMRPEWAGSAAGAPVQRPYDPYRDTLYGCLKQIRAGVTSALHSHIYVGGPVESYARSTREVLRGYRDSGLRCAFALGIRDRYSFAFTDDEAFIASLPEALRVASNIRPIRCDMDFAQFHALLRELAAEFPEVQMQIGPWNPIWCSDGLLGQIADASAREGWRVHTHLCETRYQAEWAHRNLGRSWTRHLDAIGLMNERFSGAHGIWVDGDDLDLIKARGAQLVHNPSSNMRLASGIAPVRDFLARGIPVAFGLDSLSMNDDEDMFQDLRLGQVAQNRPGVDGKAIPAATLYGMATQAGAQVTGLAGVGSLEPGSRADALLVSLTQVAGGYADQPLADLLMRRAKAAHVKTVLIGGRVMVDEGQWSGTDPAALEAELAASLGEPAPQHGNPHVNALKQVVRDGLRSYDA